MEVVIQKRNEQLDTVKDAGLRSTFGEKTKVECLSQRKTVCDESPASARRM